MIEIGLGHYLSLGAIIFFLGVIGIFLNRKNVIVILMSIELILLAVNINLISFSIFSNSPASWATSKRAREYLSEVSDEKDLFVLIFY